jgi:hypothetical protein
VNAPGPDPEAPGRRSTLTAALTGTLTAALAALAGALARAGRVPAVQRFLEVAGVVLAAWAAVVLSALGAFLTPMRVGTVLVPVAVVLAVAGNAALVGFTRRVTERRPLVLLPGALWLALSFVAASRTTEGDLVLYQSNWVATVYLLAGAVTIGVAGYRLIVRSD